MKLTKTSRVALVVGILPAFILYVVFAIYPILQSFYYSVMDWNGFNEMTFIGLDNFRKLFT
ncbi:sugar ABC transporter permease, partial [Paenibacillus phytohabitans]